MGFKSNYFLPSSLFFKTQEENCCTEQGKYPRNELCKKLLCIPWSSYDRETQGQNSHLQPGSDDYRLHPAKPSLELFAVIKTTKG